MHKKEKEAIAFLRSAAEHAKKQGRKLTLGFSAGKDSVVIYHLAIRAGIEFEAVHSVTTVDPPGTLKFIREHYPEVKIERSYLTFYSLVEQKGTPGRMKRFCCEHLKERSGIGKLFINGSRTEEGSDRSGREPEWCDTRKYMKGCKHYFPILSWSL
ncbi:MAG: phosphoadenosine phosphosulfate reductase family protein [Clostridium sp.]|nr:phosphoadenosine phosphosulfate reductase family protein [Clostridium sp.]